MLRAWPRVACRHTQQAPMSQASRSHVRARARWREQVARWIVRETFGIEIWRGGGAPDAEWCVACRGITYQDNTIEAATLALVDHLAARLLVGQEHFDVDAARSAAGRMLAQAERDLAELEVFKDWCRERGLGPDCRLVHAFRDCLEGCGAASDKRGECDTMTHLPECEDQGQGGWPGILAREYARKRCPNKCKFYDGRRLYSVRAGDPGETVAVFRPCTTCDDGWVPHGDRRAEIVTAPARARVARRVLDALKGQPSKCTNCDGRGETGPAWEASLGALLTVADTPGVRIVGEGERERMAEVGEQVRAPCESCRGTGHNIRGVLPPIPWSKMTALRRRCLEHETHDLHTPVERQREGHQSWVREMADETRIEPGEYGGYPLGSLWLTKTDPETGAIVHTPETRVVARGRHRLEITSREVPVVTLDVFERLGPLASRDLAEEREMRPHLDDRIAARGWSPWMTGWHEIPLAPPSRPLRRGEQGPRDRCPQGPRRRARRIHEPRWRRDEVRRAEEQRQLHIVSVAATELNVQRMQDESLAAFRERILQAMRPRTVTTIDYRSRLLCIEGVDAAIVYDRHTDPTLPPFTVCVSWRGSAGRDVVLAAFEDAVQMGVRVEVVPWERAVQFL